MNRRLQEPSSEFLHVTTTAPEPDYKSNDGRQILPHPPAEWKSKDAKRVNGNNHRDATSRRDFPSFVPIKTEICNKQRMLFIDKSLVTWLPLGMLTLCVCVPPYLPHFSSPPLLLHLHVLSPFLFSPISVLFHSLRVKK